MKITRQAVADKITDDLLSRFNDLLAKTFGV